MAISERVTRWALGCAIACVIPLAIWSGGCGDKTVVEADAATEGGPSDATSSDMNMDTGAAMQCCSASEGNNSRCASDGTTVQTCTYYQNAGECADRPMDGGPNTSGGYGYVWRAYTCPKGCTSSSGTAASCNP